MEKPGLAILIGKAMKAKGSHAKEEESEGEYDKGSVKSEQLHEIMTDFLAAVEDKDAAAMAELFEEAFECLEMAPHEEGEHLE